jgi:hypothetical protein
VPVEINKTPRRVGPAPEGVTMRIEVTRTMKASPNGIKVLDYVAGQVYEMPESLGKVFVRERWGVEAPEERAEEVEDVDDGPVDFGTHDLTVPQVRELIAGETDQELLKALRRGERAHPTHKGGRSGAIDALDERIGELEE